MMSCGMAAVPRLRSAGRELLILSRAPYDPKFWLLYCSSFPLSSILYHEHCFSVFLTLKPPPELPSSNSLEVKLGESMIRHNNTEQECFTVTLLRLRQRWPDKNCCVCTAPPRPLRFTRSPLRITSEGGQVVHLSHL